ncbi:MAG: hypothetical protein J4G11_13250 [Acidimicrobiia bacterium]|nr:hypothetical protein [Acidimicrobiia bacterium]
MGWVAARCVARYETHGSVSPEWLVDRYWLRGVPTREEMLGIAGLLVEKTMKAYEHFERGGSQPDLETTDWSDYKIYQCVEAAREASVRVARREEFRLKAGRPSSSSVYDQVRAAVSSATRSETSERDQQKRYDKLIEDEREQQELVARLEREHEFVRTEAARVAKPRGLWLAASAFAYLTVVGVVVPVVGLAWRPVWSGLLARRWLVGLFVSGLLVLGWYLFWAIRQLSESSVPQDQDEPTQVESGEPPGV